MKRTPIIPVRWIPERHDSDWDGTPNYRDCQPFNPHEHGIFKKAVSVAKKVGKELATVPEVHIEEKEKYTLFGGAPFGGVPLRTPKKYVPMWDKKFVVYKKIGGPSYMEMFQYASPIKSPKIFNYITSQLNKKEEIYFDELVRKFNNEPEKTFETLKWMYKHDKIELVVDKYRILYIIKR